MTSQANAVKMLIDGLPEEERTALLANYAKAAAPEAPRSMRLLRPAEAARAMGISTTTLWRLRKEGRIPVVEIRRGSIRIAEDAVRHFVEERA